jgi:hypothetical protein
MNTTFKIYKTIDQRTRVCCTLVGSCIGDFPMQFIISSEYTHIQLWKNWYLKPSFGSFKRIEVR